MKTLSDPTLGLLIEVGAGNRVTASDLVTLMMKADLDRYGHSDVNKQELMRSRLRGAQKAAEQGDAAAHRALLTFVRLFVEKTVNDPEKSQGWFAELREALLADGYELRWDGTATGSIGSGYTSFSLPSSLRYEILPTDAESVPLHTQISALERELGSHGYTDALNHYRQAINAFLLHDYEAANSQLRTALEDLVVQLAVKHAGFVKPANQGGGKQAVDRLTTTGCLDDGDGGDLLKGLWRMAHTKGSHPGRSNADETRFRLQVITAMARLLLHRLP